jgi:acetoin utilization protein AcuB
MEVTRWMTKNPVVVESKDSLATVRRKMDKGNFHRVPVVDDGKLVGIVSDRDLREHVGSHSNVRVSGAMTKQVVSVAPTTMLEQAANLLVKHRIGGLPVVEQGKVVGIVTATDLLRAFAEVLGRHSGRCLTDRSGPGRRLFRACDGRATGDAGEW